MGRRSSYIREWRKKHHLTLDQVADRLAVFDDPHLPKTGASLSRVETGKQPYNQRLIEALAEVFACEPHELLGKNPLIENTVIDMVAKLDAKRQSQLVAFIRALEEADGTNG